MTEEHAFWQGYIDSLQPLLRVQDWTVKLSGEAPDNPNHVASIELFYGRMWAVLRVAPRFIYESPEEQRQTIVHELLHLHTNRAKHVFERIADGRTEGWLKLGGEFHTEAVEYTTDILADIIAPFLPLPERTQEQPE